MTYRPQFILLACAIALTVGCAQNKTQKQAHGDWESQTETADASGETSVSADGNNTAACSTADASCAARNPLAGAWSLAVPRRNQQSASITAKDETHVIINAGENLSGEYVVQGQYLLILTRDEKLRPLAWRINSPDSLTVVRPPDLGEGAANYTGVTLVRAASDSSDPEDAAAATNTNEASTR